MNRTYNAGAVPVFNAAGSSAVIRAEFAAISTGVGALEAEIDAVAASAEWINPAYTETYLSATQFSWASVDATAVMLKNRRVRCTVSGAYVYSVVVSAVYSGGNTTVTLLDAVLDNPLTLVEYALAIPETAASLGLVLADSAAITDVDDADILAVAVASVLKKITFAELRSLLITAASKEQMETATDPDTRVSPLNVNWHPGVAKAWVQCGVSGNKIVSHNVASVTDSGVGRVTINLVTNFSSADYVILPSLNSTNVLIPTVVNNAAAGTFEIRSRDSAGTLEDPNEYNIVCFGDQ